MQMHHYYIPEWEEFLLMAREMQWISLTLLKPKLGQATQTDYGCRAICSGRNSGLVHAIHPATYDYDDLVGI